MIEIILSSDDLKLFKGVKVKRIPRINRTKLRVSQANHDPDFDLAEGSHQVAILCVLVRMITKIINTILNLHRISTRIRKNSNE